MTHEEKTFSELVAVIVAFENISQKEAKAKAFKMINNELNKRGI